MARLSLFSLYQHLYDTTIACAYIYYGTKDHPTDQDGTPIKNFYPSPQVLANRLASLLPVVNMRLTKSGYKATDIDFLNNAPQPFFVIKRNDGQALSTDDIATLTDLLKKPLESDLNHATQFGKVNHASNPAPSVHSMKLRPR